MSNNIPNWELNDDILEDETAYYKIYDIIGICGGAFELFE